ncbi:hypothetical protein AMD27_12200 [Acinetobacter sp. TGL-Y2]|nr:hypothetical protein AMD27_12200 [Acinetobacter sp. TGL-Y2]
MIFKDEVQNYQLDTIELQNVALWIKAETKFLFSKKKEVNLVVSLHFFSYFMTCVIPLLS